MNALILVIMLACLPTSAAADIYKYIDSKGQLHITDKKLGEPYQLISVMNFSSATQHQTFDNPLNIEPFLKHIRSAAKKYDLDPALLHAIVETESSFDPNARSKAGAVGLMQLMPNTAAELGVKDRYDPEQNIQAGALYFRQLLDKFNQNIQLSLAAYNAGETAVKRAGSTVPNFPETQRYVKKVIAKYRELK